MGVHAARHFALGLDQPRLRRLPGREGLQVPHLVLVVIVADPGDLLFAIGCDAKPLLTVAMSLSPSPMVNN